MGTFPQDLRYAFRQLRRSPGFAMTAILTLMMAIAANVVGFGVLDALVLQALPVPEASRVVQVQRTGSISMSYPNYRDIRDRNKTFSGVAIYRLARIGLDANAMAQPVWGLRSAAITLPCLGCSRCWGGFCGNRMM